MIKKTSNFPTVKFTTIFSIKCMSNRINIMTERSSKMGKYFLKLRKSTGRTHTII